MSAPPSEGADLSLSSLLDAAGQPATPVRDVSRRRRSFDVFDTVLTRRVGAPTALIRLLAVRLDEQGVLPCAPEVFAEARIRYEHALTRQLGRPSRLKEISAAVADALGLGPESADAMYSAELALERELSVPVPGAAAMLEQARASAGSPVVFVSDTPHPESLLRELLEQGRLWRAGDRVYSSADRGASKDQGGLFSIVEQDVGRTGHDILHVGDNPRSDVAAARAAGWQAASRSRGQLSRYEKIIEAHGSAIGPAASYLAGASRIARLEAIERGVSSELAAVASGVVAPLLIGYVRWLATQAALRGFKRLYFVSRDGQVMLRLARPLLARLAPEVECRYLYGSRQPWMLAACAYSDENRWKWLEVVSDFTLRTLLQRVKLTPEQVHELVQSPLTDPARGDQPLAAEDREKLSQLLLSPPLAGLVERAAQSAAEVMTSYLRQEGLLDGVPSALVDAGWRGTAANAFDQVLQHAGGQPATHLMMGVLDAKRSSSAVSGPELIAWLFDERARPGSVQGFPSPAVLIEMFCAGDEGRVLGYERQGSQVVPQLTTERNEPVLEWGLPEVHDIAARVAELCLDGATDTMLPQADWAALVWPLLEAFWLRPTPAEARTWGSFPFEAEIWPPYSPVAQAISTRDVLRRLGRGDVQLRRVSSWRAGSAAISPQPWKSLLQARQWQESNRFRLRRLPRRLRLEFEQRRPRR